MEIKIPQAAKRKYTAGCLIITDKSAQYKEFVLVRYRNNTTKLLINRKNKNGIFVEYTEEYDDLKLKTLKTYGKGLYRYRAKEIELTYKINSNMLTLYLPDSWKAKVMPVFTLTEEISTDREDVRTQGFFMYMYGENVFTVYETRKSAFEF